MKQWSCFRGRNRFGFLGTFMLYIVLFYIGVRHWGVVSTAFAIFPVVFTAWVCGARPGLLTVLLATLLGMGLRYSVSVRFFPAETAEFLVGTGTLFGIALLVGLLSDGKQRIARELRERKEAEEALAKTEKWYRSIFDGVNDAVLVESVDGKVLEVNERACEMFGWDHETFLTKTVADMVPPEYDALVTDDGSGMLEKEFETVNMRANGEYFPVSVSGRFQQIDDEKRLLVIVRDITEQYRIRQELKKNHQFLSHVIESLSHPFYVVNVEDYSIAIANSAARGLDALDPTTTCYALTHRRDTPCGGDEHLCPLQEVLRTKQAVRVEHVHYNSEGEQRDVEIYAHPIFNERGQIVQMIESSVDITERKQEAEQIRRLGRAVEQALDGMAISDLYGNIVFVNQAWASMHGFDSTDELLGVPLTTFHTDEQMQNEVERINTEAMESGAVQREIGHMRRDGSTFPTWMSVSTLRDEDGALSGLIASAHDISERKKSEEELHKLYRATTQSSASIVITNLHGEIEYVNPAFTEVTGYSREEALGKNPRILKSDVHDPELYRELWNTIALGNVWRGELCNKNKAGELFWESASISPVQDTNGKITHYVAVKENITEKKKILAEMEQAKNAAEAAAKAKADFLANMSHEIRTPLNAIYGMTSLMLNTPLNEEQQDFIKTIRGGGETLLHVINDILDFSKIEAGKLELEKQPFYVRDCVEDALDLLAEKAAEKELELAYFIEDGTPPLIVGDITRLRQILVNLLNNGIKFTDTGEVVVNVAGKPADGDQFEVHFSVRDTGIGIPPEKTDQLFKSFSQLDTSTTRKYGGTGLGLAISSDLTKAMGGRMWVESEVGVGSVFHFTILVTGDPNAVPAIPTQDLPKLTDKRVLVVDDNATNRLILRKQTESWDMQAVTASSGAEALQVVDKDANFDLGIFDMQMPEMDGCMLAEQLGKTQQFPVIILTSLTHTLVSEKEPSVAALLNKPIKTSSLFNTILHVLDTASTAKKTKKAVAEFDSGMGKEHPLHILLVEDNAINQKVALKLLGRLGYKADLAGNGIEALDALKRQSYDVVFMDIQMPEMDGDEATRRIRAEWAEAEQPYIIAMTAHALEGDREKYLERGMDDYVSKPIGVDALVRSLDGALERKIAAESK